MLLALVPEKLPDEGSWVKSRNFYRMEKALNKFTVEMSDLGLI